MKERGEIDSHEALREHLGQELEELDRPGRQRTDERQHRPGGGRRPELLREWRQRRYGR